LFKIAGREQQQTRAEDEDNDSVKRRQDPLGAPLVKALVAERACAQLRPDAPADQVAGDHEEDVDAGEAAAEPDKTAVIKHNA
jgi:hypothetical protein